MSEGSIRANPYSTAPTTVTAPDSPGDPAGMAGPAELPADPPDRRSAPERHPPAVAGTPAGPSVPGRAHTTHRSLLPSLAPLLRAWLPRQRWFAGKGNPITGFSLVSATEILPCTAGGAAPGLLHLLVRARQRPGTADCYQLLIGIRSALPPHLAHTLIGRPAEGPLHGRTVYEALADPRLAGLLLERLRVPGRLGALRFTRAPGTAIASGLTPRLITAEQSNSSVVYGDAYILKVFRRIGTGVNPDLELPLALARAGCDRVPHPTAWFEADPGVEAAAGAGPASVPADDPAGGPLTLGILQPFLPGSADGWQLALGSLSVGADFTGAAHALGRATAEVHTALADALPTAVLRRPQIELIACGMAERLEAAAAAVPALRPYREPLRAAYDELAALGNRGRTWHAQRIHGDLHLGQALRTAHDGRWSLIDFEGEPARPISERRRLQPVARDIAGMLRSFDYAARTHRPASGGAPGWSGQWSWQSRAAYCGGYAEAAGTDPRDEPELLRAYETDKAVYEVLYEARHRPDWLPVPMAAIRRLAGEPERGGAPAPGPGRGRVRGHRGRAESGPPGSFGGTGAPGGTDRTAGTGAVTGPSAGRPAGTSVPDRRGPSA